MVMFGAEALPLDVVRVDLDDLIGMLMGGTALALGIYQRISVRTVPPIIEKVEQLVPVVSKVAEAENGITARLKVQEALRVEDAHRIERLEQHIAELRKLLNERL